MSYAIKPGKKERKSKERSFCTVEPSTEAVFIDESNSKKVNESISDNNT
jgi:hypothetical protein